MNFEISVIKNIFVETFFMFYVFSSECTAILYEIFDSVLESLENFV